MRSLKNKWNLEKPQLELTDEITISVNDEPEAILDATFAIQDAQAKLEQFQDIKQDEMTAEDLKSFSNGYKELKDAFYQSVHILTNDSDYEKILSLNLSLNNLTLLFNEMVKTAQKVEENEEEDTGSKSEE
jgi:hypothetical protein